MLAQAVEVNVDVFSDSTPEGSEVMATERSVRVRTNVPQSLLTICFMAVMLAASSALAGSLLVNAGAANQGAFGLEVVIPACGSQADLTISSGPLGGAYESCETITAGTAAVTSPTTFTAGASIALGDGFSVASGTTFTAAIDPSISSFAWVQDDSPADETTYTAEFYVRIPVGFAIGALDQIEHFVAYYGGVPQLKVVLGDGPDMQLQVRNDLGGWVNSGWTSALSRDVWHKVEVIWQAAATATVTLDVDDGNTVQVTPIDTSDRRIASVRWGSVGGIADGTSNSIYLDDFGSWR